MKAGLTIVILTLVFLGLGAASRCWRLGWSMQGDEPSSFEEVKSLADRPFLLQSPQKLDRLPRANPVGYGLLSAGYSLFGTDEAGARKLPALAGAVAIAAVVLLAGTLYGPGVGVIAGAMILLWPWHIFHSQNNRTYSFAFLLACVAMLSGALAWRANSWSWGALAGVACAMAVACHNTAILVAAAMVGFGIIERFFGAGNRRRGQDALVTRGSNALGTSLAMPYPARAAGAFAIVGGPLLAAACGLAAMGMRGWGGDAAEGYSVAHTLMGLAFNLTWPVALLAAIGWVLAWRDQDHTWRIAALAALAALAAALVAPKLAASFRHDYLLAASGAFVLLAAKTVATVAGALATRSRALAVAVVVAILAMSLPSVASYYTDGDRPDYRAAAAYIAKHGGSDDVVAGSNSESLEYYLHRTVRTVSRPEEGDWRNAVKSLDLLTGGGRPVWLVWHYSRNELPADMDRWLWGHARRVLHHKAKRFDYHENVVDVYLVEPGATAGAMLPRAAGKHAPAYNAEAWHQTPSTRAPFDNAKGVEHASLDRSARP